MVRRTPWLLRAPDDAAEGRVFCFPYSGMGASMFNRWPRWIGRFETCLIQLPARENRIREPHFGSFDRLADVLAPELEPYLDRPFAFFGHCAGALPAYETARRLAGAAPPGLGSLVVSGQVAPHDCPHDRFLDLDDDALRAELAELAVQRGGRPDPAMLDLGLEVLRRDLQSNRHYRLAEPVTVGMDIAVVHWDADPEVDADLLTGWRHYADEVTFEVLPGAHYEFLTAPGPLTELLASRLRKRIAP